MTGETDTVIGHTVLREIVCANLLTAVSGLYLRVPRLAQFLLPSGLLDIPQSRLEYGERLRPVFQLRLLILASDDQARGKVRDAYRRVRGIHTLTTMPC